MPNNLDELYKKITDLQKQVNEVVQEIEQLRVQDRPVLESENTENVQDNYSITSNEAVVGEVEEQIPIVGRKGVFDGIFMITDDGKKFQVPPNYVSKSMLVVGDMLEIVDVDETGSKYSFKQEKNVERKEVEGILTKKDNQWAVHTDEGIYYVVAAAVRFHKADVGDVVAVLLPAHTHELPVEWAAFKEIRKQALREKFEPRAKQYMQQAQDGASSTQHEAPATEAQKQDSTPELPESQKEIVKSRLSTPVVPPTPAPAAMPETPQPAPVHEDVVGEVTMSPHDTSEPQTGEVTLSDEDLWELR